MTVRDFMNYLVYVEHSAENLQFYLWYKDYVKRFNEASTSDIALAPEWTQAMEEDAITRIRKDQAEKTRSAPQAAEIFKGTDFEKQGMELPETGKNNPFNTPPRTPHGGSDSGSVFSAPHTVNSGTVGSYKSQAAEAFQAAGAKLPCKSAFKFTLIHYTIQPQQLTVAT